MEESVKSGLYDLFSQVCGSFFLFIIGWLVWHCSNMPRSWSRLNSFQITHSNSLQTTRKSFKVVQARWSVRGGQDQSIIILTSMLTIFTRIFFKDICQLCRQASQTHYYSPCLYVKLFSVVSQWILKCESIYFQQGEGKHFSRILCNIVLCLNIDVNIVKHYNGQDTLVLMIKLEGKLFQ